jgi:hypothetical protein
MPNQPNQPNPTNQPNPPSHIALSFDRDEWEMIVTLPRRVLVAASAAEPASAHRSVAEGLAGIEAIASGLGSPSPLVREVVGTIYAEAGHHAMDDPGDVGILQTLAACRYASEVLVQRCTTDDASAYRDWLHHIAAAVSGAARGSPAAAQTDVPAGRVALAENRFLYALGGVLRP